ncbi:hypothetical protein [Bradyrhizobium sp. CCBAU 53380]|uniref:hypothetical protein n=1 Tax=Bradyrhizobium sp. CCBAU 53380 TaxID=1325117 RepID=UPI002303D171|nr:hypothetical protein [Bradyrhizobium sp. CCBAU 53380]
MLGDDAIGDPTHPEHENMRLCGPEQLDPNAVDRKTLDVVGNAFAQNLEAAASRHAAQIDVKRQSKGPQSYAYFRSTEG